MKYISKLVPGTILTRRLWMYDGSVQEVLIMILGSKNGKVMYLNRQGEVLTEAKFVFEESSSQHWQKL